MSKIQLNACIVIVLFLLVTAAVQSVKPFKLEGRQRTDFSAIPLKIGDWTGRQTEVDQRTKDMLPSCSLLMRFYERDYDLSPVGFTVIYGSDLGDFHQPEVCLEGQGLRTVSKGVVKIPDGEGGAFDAVRLITEADYRRQVFVFWFYTKGMSSTSLGRYKLNMLMDRMFMRKIQPSAMIRLSTVVADTETEEDAMIRAINLASTVLPYLKRELDAPSPREHK